MSVIFHESPAAADSRTVFVFSLSLLQDFKLNFKDLQKLGFYNLAPKRDLYQYLEPIIKKSWNSTVFKRKECRHFIDTKTFYKFDNSEGITKKVM